MSEITVTLPDGSNRTVPSGTFIRDIAGQISPGLAKAALAGVLDGTLVDLTHQVSHNASLRIITDRSPEALALYRHSTAHLLAAAVTSLFPGAQCGIGPATEDGFFYDFVVDRPFVPEDLAAIEKKMKELAAADLVYERQMWSRDKAREWAASLRSTLRELGLEHERLAVDKLDAAGFLALQDEGISIVDVGPATVDAREVKTPEEVQLCVLNGGIGDAMLAEFEAAIRPGIREFELLAVLSDSLLRRHGEGLFTRLVASGTNTNPWLTEAHDKLVMPGDLVGVDTDANGYEGYVIDVSRIGRHAPASPFSSRYSYSTPPDRLPTRTRSRFRLWGSTNSDSPKAHLGL
jgi:hypothetical protein